MRKGSQRRGRREKIKGSTKEKAGPSALLKRRRAAAERTLSAKTTALGMTAFDNGGHRKNGNYIVNSRNRIMRIR